jgi:hypothetical protein
MSFRANSAVKPAVASIPYDVGPPSPNHRYGSFVRRQQGAFIIEDRRRVCDFLQARRIIVIVLGDQVDSGKLKLFKLGVQRSLASEGYQIPCGPVVKTSLFELI